MPTPRNKDRDWNLCMDTLEWSQVPTLVLMDIRDELKRLNSLLHCHNFTSLPSEIRGLRRDIKQGNKKRRKYA